MEQLKCWKCKGTKLKFVRNDPDTRKIGNRFEERTVPMYECQDCHNFTDGTPTDWK